MAKDYQVLCDVLKKEFRPAAKRRNKTDIIRADSNAMNGISCCSCSSSAQGTENQFGF